MSRLWLGHERVPRASFDDDPDLAELEHQLAIWNEGNAAAVINLARYYRRSGRRDDELTLLIEAARWQPFVDKSQRLRYVALALRLAQRSKNADVGRQATLLQEALFDRPEVVQQKSTLRLHLKQGWPLELFNRGVALDDLEFQLALSLLDAGDHEVAKLLAAGFSNAGDDLAGAWVLGHAARSPRIPRRHRVAMLHESLETAVRMRDADLAATVWRATTTIGKEAALPIVELYSSQLIAEGRASAAVDALRFCGAATNPALIARFADANLAAGRPEAALFALHGLQARPLLSFGRGLSRNSEFISAEVRSFVALGRFREARELFGTRQQFVENLDLVDIARAWNSAGEVSAASSLLRDAARRGSPHAVAAYDQLLFEHRRELERAEFLTQHFGRYPTESNVAVGRNALEAWRALGDTSRTRQMEQALAALDPALAASLPSVRVAQLVNELRESRSPATLVPSIITELVGLGETELASRVSQLAVQRGARVQHDELSFTVSEALYAYERAKSLLDLARDNDSGFDNDLVQQLVIATQLLPRLGAERRLEAFQLFASAVRMQPTLLNPRFVEFCRREKLMLDGARVLLSVAEDTSNAETKCSLIENAAWMFREVGELPSSAKCLQRVERTARNRRLSSSGRLLRLQMLLDTRRHDELKDAVVRSVTSGETRDVSSETFHLALEACFRAGEWALMEEIALSGLTLDSQLEASTYDFFVLHESELGSDALFRLVSQMSSAELSFKAVVHAFSGDDEDTASKMFAEAMAKATPEQALDGLLAMAANNAALLHRSQIVAMVVNAADGFASEDAPTSRRVAVELYRLGVQIADRTGNVGLAQSCVEAEREVTALLGLRAYLDAQGQPEVESDANGDIALDPAVARIRDVAASTFVVARSVLELRRLVDAPTTAQSESGRSLAVDSFRVFRAVVSASDEGQVGSELRAETMRLLKEAVRSGREFAVDLSQMSDTRLNGLLADLDRASTRAAISALDPVVDVLKQRLEVEVAAEPTGWALFTGAAFGEQTEIPEVTERLNAAVDGLNERRIEESERQSRELTHTVGLIGQMHEDPETSHVAPQVLRLDPGGILGGVLRRVIGGEDVASEFAPDNLDVNGCTPKVLTPWKVVEDRALPTQIDSRRQPEAVELCESASDAAYRVALGDARGATVAVTDCENRVAQLADGDFPAKEIRELSDDLSRLVDTGRGIATELLTELARRHSQDDRGAPILKQADLSREIEAQQQVGLPLAVQETSDAPDVFGESRAPDSGAELGGRVLEFPTPDLLPPSEY